MNKLFYLALLITVPGVLIINKNVILQFFYKNPFALESSVWCFKGSIEANLCKFKNICYDLEYKSLLFFLSNKTIIKGIGHYMELQKIQLSSIHSHNQFYANLSVIDTAKYENKKPVVVYEKAFIFSRFKPNNLMHIIHDDLFPLFLTLESACLGDEKCIGGYNLVMLDHYPEGPYFELYCLFSNQPLVLNKIVPTKLCFEEALIGLIQDGVFFQYGFDKPQGAVATNFLNQNDIYRFTKYIKNKLNIESSGDDFLQVVLLNRTKNRKILNIERVQELIKFAYEKLLKKIKIKIINLNSSINVIDLIKTISKADVLVGMHGAEIILALFMKPNSIVFELFPFGIQPNAVSFVKQVSELGNSQLVYFPWRNRYRSHSVAPINAHPLFGGIAHLNKTIQEKIKTTVEVPAVKCCNNPLYLYYMYQDTLVSDEFGDFFYKSLLEFYSHKKPISEKMMHKWFFPYKVSNISCSVDSQEKYLNITWQSPFNVNSDNLIYKLYVKGGEFEKEFSTKKLTLQVDVQINVKYQVWISVHYDLNNSESPDLYIECS